MSFMKSIVIFAAGAFLAAGTEAAAPTPEAQWQQKEFVITMYCPPEPTEENFRILARDGYSLAWVWGNCDQVKALDEMQRYGLKGLLAVNKEEWGPQVMDDPVRREEFVTLIQKVRNHPAFYGYYIVDEPSAVTFPALRKYIDFIRHYDSDHLFYINLFPTYATPQQLGVFQKEYPELNDVGIPDNFAGLGDIQKTELAYQEHLRLYLRIVNPQLLSYDHYHFLKDGAVPTGPDGLQYFLNLELVRNCALKAGIPFWNILQGSAFEPWWRPLSYPEYRWLAFTTMAYGAKGYSWFLYRRVMDRPALMNEDGSPTPQAELVAKVNREAAEFGPELMCLTSSGVYHSDPLPQGTRSMNLSPVRAKNGQYIVGMFHDNAGNEAFMIVNRDYKNPAVATVTLPPESRGVREFSAATKEWTDTEWDRERRIMRVPLEPGAGKLFRIQK